MIQQFDWLESRYQELTEELNQPETIANQPLWRKLLKEHSALEPKLTAYHEYCRLLREESDAKELLSQPDMAQLAALELERLTLEIAAKEQELKLLLLPKDPDEEKSIVLEIRQGAGGDEAALFGADLLRMYTRYAERHRFTVEPVSLSMTELGGVKEAILTISGSGVFGRLKYESGVHRVKRVPETESSGRLHTSTCTVAVLPEAEEMELIIAPEDLRIDTFRSSGHGGQYVNTTDSAVRITHIPTGIVATCQDEKSQLKNRDKAMRVLRTRLYDKMREESDGAYAELRRGLIGGGERSERIRTYHFLQSYVKDHRIGLTLNRVGDTLDGDLDEIIDALMMTEQMDKLKKLGEQRI